MVGFGGFLVARANSVSPRVLGKASQLGLIARGHLV